MRRRTKLTKKVCFNWMYNDLRKKLCIQKTLERESEMVDQLI